MEKLKKRNVSPKSLANLRPVKPGDPPRNPTGVNGKRPYTGAMESMANEPMPNPLRLALNIQAKKQLTGIGVRMKEELYFENITWAQANAMRRHLKAVIEGDTRDAVELREAVEGRATQRIEMTGSYDRTMALAESLKIARQNPPPLPEAKPADAPVDTPKT